MARRNFFSALNHFRDVGVDSSAEFKNTSAIVGDIFNAFLPRLRTDRNANICPTTPALCVQAKPRFSLTYQGKPDSKRASFPRANRSEITPLFIFLTRLIKRNFQLIVAALFCFHARRTADVISLIN